MAANLGEQLDALIVRMDAAYAAWKAAGYPDAGPVVDEKEATYAALRAWTARAQAPRRV